MAKVSTYTELTTFTGDETFYVVEDDDGTPVSRRVTFETLMAAAARLAGNSVINGRLDIWQRGTSFAAVAHLAATADRFVFGQSAGTAAFTVTRETDVPTGTDLSYSLKLDVTTANASPAAGHEAHIRYAVEGYDFAALYGRECALSFWVKTNKTGTHCIAVVKTSDTQTYLGTYTVSVADTWERKTVIIPFQSEVTSGWNFTNGIGCKIRWALYAGTTFQSTGNQWNAGNFINTAASVNIADSTNGYLSIAGVKLHPGSSEIDAPARPFAAELNLCKRYYEQSYNYDVAPGTNTNEGTHLTSVAAMSTTNGQSWPLGMHPRFTVEKRTTPTVALYKFDGTANQWDLDSARISTAGQVSATGFRVHNNTGGSVTPTAARAFGHWTATAEL